VDEKKQKLLITALLHQVSNPNIYQNFIQSLFRFRTVKASCSWMGKSQLVRGGG